MASGPITLGQIEGEKMKAVTDFIFLDSKITLDSDCSHEIKRYLLLGRKAMTKLNNILKNGDIALPTKFVPGFNAWAAKIPWRRKRQPTPVPLLGNPMDRGAWWATVLGVVRELDTTK